jgi:hypothetical protein
MNKLALLICVAVLIGACQNSDQNKSGSENDIDAARNFIQAALYNDYQKARSYMLQDTQNLNQMAAIERINLSPEEKKGLAEASINIHKVTPVNDSTTIVIYSNSYKNNQDTLRVKKIDGTWLVDFDYIWNHDVDTLQPPPLLKTDSTRK